ncbi:hypothetical protein B9Q12_01090 [Candidatus Marsarchaeota G2 archaeon ECH_B_SAG-G06]|uniref:Uncharacterized protein n=1 Tax=Candidatus Marsarchaeota G2 archaeon ECH_B_SAG-G06 TaxID=1978166 RepID=A0A2R6C2Z5_9ARCH|nr:MAG: hypothetical protein B9Q12_01090 [Candidatus Marsarchaeota G2 archaeon ECH_B_SAG-G06]
MNAKKGVSNTVFVAVAAVLVITTAIGFGLYATKSASTTTVPTTVLSTVTQFSTVTQYSTVTQFSTVTKTITPPSSGSFYNGQVITFYYTSQFMCTPALTTFFPNETQANNLTMGCEVGAAQMSAFPSDAEPVYVLVPAFAGLSIFGVTQLGATPQGFPVFEYNGQNITILTDCGASGTPAGCPDHPLYLYSPAFTAVEEHLGIKNGVFGLPEGVLPTPAHSHLVTFATNQSIPWYLVIVLVFDPNIFPNPVTGQCTQIVPSNLSNPTANCLNSYSALEAAFATHDSAVSTANTNNPIWQTLGGPTLQVVVPGITSVSQLSSASNSNMLLYFSDPAVYPYPF